MESKECFHLQQQQNSMNASSDNSIVPNKEYLLQGSILDNSVDALLHRLRGLCDNAELRPEPFHDQEMCFSLRGASNNNSSPQIVNLRVRRAIDYNNTPDLPYQLRYIGDPELGTGDKARPTVVRSSVDVAVTPSIIEYLTELGAKLEFEYMARGHIFRKGRMKITISKISKGSPRDGQIKQDEFLSNSHLVELSVLAPSGQEAIGEEMKAFAEQLKPLVHLDKVDYKRH